MHKVEWHRTAAKALRKLPAEVQGDIEAAAGALGSNPRPAGVRKLTGPLAGLWRIQVGIHYRVVYSIDDKAKVVRIVNVGSRERIY